MYIKKRGKAKVERDKQKIEEGAAAPAAQTGAFVMGEEDFDHRLGVYQLMEGIGKGGYGTVYKGINAESGMTVAVKRVNLAGIPPQDLESIEMEIRLLQNLAHPNIVKYLDSIRSDDYLNIILEFVENGALSSLLVKFGGSFPETLCAHYIAQVLKGLHYLHSQGVVHRDIKGANILSTKMGQVKLADFGVATKLNESRKSDSVVGTPYWMAPEIIEMTGQQSSACDIWSVGCTAIELLTGKPPYFDLQQMPALFRIVQDDHPPLPDNISGPLENFLMECFQKDPNRRIDAAGLLKHQWLKKSMDQQEEEELKLKALLDASRKGTGGAGGPSKSSHANPSSAHDSEESDWDEDGTVASSFDEKKASASAHLRGKSAAVKAAGGAAANKTPGKPNGKGVKTEGGDSENEDWDADGVGSGEEELLPSTQRRPSHKGRQASTAAWPQEHKRQKSRGAAGKIEEEPEELTIKLRAPADEGDVFAEFSDGEDGFDEPDEDAEEVVEKTQMKTIRPTPQITPAALMKKPSGSPTGAVPTQPTALGGANVVSPTQTLTLPQGGSSTSSTISGSFPLTTNIAGVRGVAGSSTVTTSSSSSAGGNNLTISGPQALSSFVENDEDELDDYGELEGELDLPDPVKVSGGGSSGASTGALGPGGKNGAMGGALAAGGANKSATGAGADAKDDFNDDEADPFDDITFDEGDGASGEDVLLNRAFLRVLDLLSPQNEERVILDACERLHEMGTKNPDQIRNLMTNHGVIPIMEMLEVQNTHILHAVLKVVNQIVGKNVKFQQNMSLVGLIPAIIRFGGAAYPTEIRMESASFVRQFCYATDWTRKMFIACDGLPVLVSFLLEDYKNSKTLVWNAIDCIRHVFDINTSPKNDFCRLFCKFGLLEPLSKTLIAIQSDTESADAPDYVLKIAKILHLFSQGDKVVKLHFAKPAVIESMLRVLPSLPQEILILLLKSIRNISMDSTTLDLLESAGAIPALIPFLDASQVSENQHQVLLTMYYLCQIKSSRQEQAALSGIIPHLQRFIRLDHPLKQFAYPIIFLLAKTSNKSRLELKKHGGLQFYIDILVSADLYWRSYALEIIAYWVGASTEDAARVSFVLNTSSNLNKLVRVFHETTDEAQFDKLGNSMKKLLASSTSVNQSLGRLKEFIREIKTRLDKHANSNNIRLTLLRILSLMVSTHANPEQLIADADGLLELIYRLYEEKSAVIVSDMAARVLKAAVPSFAKTHGGASKPISAI